MHRDAQFSKEVAMAADSLSKSLEAISNPIIQNLGSSCLESFLMLLNKYEDCCNSNDNEKLETLKKDFFELKNVLKPFSAITNRL